MTKAELIAQMSKDANISKAAAGRALDSFTSTVTKTLKKGDKVTLVGFGTFSVSIGPQLIVTILCDVANPR